MNSPVPRSSTESPTTIASPNLTTVLASAPHRLLFFAGVVALLGIMGWWLFDLGAVTFAWSGFPSPTVPGIWLHGMLAQYGMLGPFIFGFLLTVFPRWTGQTALTRRAYVPIFGLIFGGMVVALAGTMLGHLWLLIGFGAMLAGWLVGIWQLLRVLLRAPTRDPWAISILVALTAGAGGLSLFFAFLIGAPATLVVPAIRLGTLAFLLPVFFTVLHRMLPFFSGGVVPGYIVRRPRSSLPILWLLLLGHLVLDAWHLPLLSMAVNILLAIFFLAHWIAWQPWKAWWRGRRGLLSVLYLAYLWLPSAFFLYALAGWVSTNHAVAIQMAALHALTVGFFSSIVVGMVTRVTHGHSGRPLAMGPIPWFTFLAIQAVAIARVLDSLVGAGNLAYTLTAAAWIIAFLPWTLRSAWIYLTPRRDGQPG